jgi:tricorn protease
VDRNDKESKIPRFRGIASLTLHATKPLPSCEIHVTILRFAFLLTVVLAAPACLHAQEPIQFARTPDISPDGKLVAFSYLGDIWVVEAIGGIARPVTMHEAHELYPCFSPDGRWIAFSSNRYGSYDVFVVPIYGGKPQRLTYDSAQDLVAGWTPDSKSILFSSARTTTFPGGYEVYSISITGGQERKLPFHDAKELSYSPIGGTVAFGRGPGIWYRKGYRGSSNDDLWLANLDGSVVRQLTDFQGQDSMPMWSSDGKRLYYVSEFFGNPANIVCQEMNSSQSPALPEGKPKPITSHKEDAVRRARISAGGEWIVYECGADLWVVNTHNGLSRKLAIEVHADEKSNSERTVTYKDNISEYAPSPDDSHIAFTVHGDIFLMPASGGKATRLTETPYVEHGLSWSPDGKKILYSADQGGQEDLFVIEQDDPEHPKLTEAHRFKTTRLTNNSEAEGGANFSPDGSRIFFLRSGKLCTMKPDGTDVKVLVDQPQVFDYDWAPDGKWIVYARLDGSFASELYVMPIDGSQPARNLTRYATYNGDVSWNNSNHKIAFVSQRGQSGGMYVMSLQKPAAQGAGSSNDIDWDDIHLRVDRPANNTAQSGIISPNGRWIAYNALQGGNDLWVASVDGFSLNRLTTGSMQPKLIRWSKNSSKIWFLDSAGALRSASPSSGGGPFGPSTPGQVSFTAKMTIHREEEFEEMFDQSWHALENHFYDSGHHGINWKAIREKYRPLVRHIAVKEDLYTLISLMLGELNASHLGISGPLPRPAEVTGDLGLLFDETYTGPGLKIKEILKRGPADKRGLKVAPGDVILSIERTPLDAKANISKLLNAKINEGVEVELSSNPADPKATKRKVELTCVGRDEISKLMYQRWVDLNAEAVSKASKGTVGYIHIPSMDEEGLEQFVRSLYSDNFDKDAIVIDVRYNGGGFTHDKVLNYLGAKEHTLFRQRDGGQGLVMRSYDRKWTKPVTLLINNRSYSDAEIFPNAFKTLGLGKVVGQATGGMVIGTTSTTLIDGSRFRLPRTGVFTVSGINMERQGVQPDVSVVTTPEELAKGSDAQLNKAVDVVMQDVLVWKKNRSSVASTPAGGGGTGTPVTAPLPKQP